MKKFYEAPVVELTGFSVEDVITTSTVTPAAIDTTGMDLETAKEIFTGYNAVNDYSAGSYEW